MCPLIDRFVFFYCLSFFMFVLRCLFGKYISLRWLQKEVGLKCLFGRFPEFFPKNDLQFLWNILLCPFCRLNIFEQNSRQISRPESPCGPCLQKARETCHQGASAGQAGKVDTLAWVCSLLSGGMVMSVGLSGFIDYMSSNTTNRQLDVGVFLDERLTIRKGQLAAALAIIVLRSPESPTVVKSLTS